MRRILIGSVIALASAAVFFVAIERFRPHLLPAWARLAFLQPTEPVEESDDPLADSGLEEDAPDDGWRAFLGKPTSADVKPSLPTIRLASSEIAAQVGLQTATVGSRTIAPTVSGNAEISFVSHDYAHITSRVSGWISEVPTDEGRMVKKGEVLVVVDSAEVGTAKAQYLGILPVVNALRKEFERTAGLKVSGAASPKAELADHTALAKAEAELLNARQRLRNMGFSASEIARIAETEDKANELRILAPMSGRLVERHAVVGEAVTPPIGAVNSGQMQALFEIADPTEMWAWIDIGESDVIKVAIGQPVTFTISGTTEPVFLRPCRACQLLRQHGDPHRARACGLEKHRREASRQPVRPRRDRGRTRAEGGRRAAIRRAGRWRRGVRFPASRGSPLPDSEGAHPADRSVGRG